MATVYYVCNQGTFRNCVVMLLKYIYGASSSMGKSVCFCVDSLSCFGSSSLVFLGIDGLAVPVVAVLASAGGPDRVGPG